MKIVHPRRKRRGVDVVIAEIVLLAITLVIGAAIAGFVYGLFGSFTHAPRVTSIGLTCVASGGNEVCTVALVNNGNTATSTTASCSLSFGGTNHAGAYMVPEDVLNVGETITGTCTVTGATAAQGTRVTGVLILADGENAIFAISAS